MYQGCIVCVNWTLNNWIFIEKTLVNIGAQVRVTIVVQFDRSKPESRAVPRVKVGP